MGRDGTVRRIKLGLKMVDTDKDGNLLGVPTRSLPVNEALLTTPEKQLPTPQQPQQESSSEFAITLTELFKMSDRGVLSVDTISNATSKQFPTWRELLKGLENENKVCICEDSIA